MAGVFHFMCRYSDDSTVSDIRPEAPMTASISPISDRSQNSQIITEIEFCAWLGQAEPGDSLEYHRGFLVVDLTPFGGPLCSEARSELARTSARAYDLAERGFVHLVQRRVGPDTFSYLAIARPLPQGKALDFSTLMTEEAA
jgi:hypothetical protein